MLFSSGKKEETVAPQTTESTQAPVDTATAVQQTTTQVAPAATVKSTTPAPAASKYTMASVATHNSASSCWTVVSGNVYDVTSWIAKHPGGKRAILSMCGIDATAAFTDQHGGQRRPEQELATFLLAPLAK